MTIKLSILPHQTDCIKAITKVFENVDIKNTTNIYSNPVFEVYDEDLKHNIGRIQNGDDDFNKIPKSLRGRVNDGTFGIDIRMETGERVIIVTGCINALRSRVSGTLVNMIHALLRVIKYNYCKQCMRSKDVLALQY